MFAPRPGSNDWCNSSSDAVITESARASQEPPTARRQSVASTAYSKTCAPFLMMAWISSTR